MQTDDIRRLIRNRYAEKDLFTAIRDYNSGVQHRTTGISVRTVSILDRSVTPG